MFGSCPVLLEVVHVALSCVVMISLRGPDRARTRRERILRLDADGPCFLESMPAGVAHLTAHMESKMHAPLYLVFIMHPIHFLGVYE